MPQGIDFPGEVLLVPSAVLPVLLSSNAKLKRAEDLIIASGLLMLMLPVMLLGALCVKLNSPGPVLFSQLRRGRDGEIIQIWKFRTMYRDASDELCQRQSVRNDPRVTPVGAFLRRHSLDELPQLFNVIRGDMSLVGPRPHALGMSIEGQLVDELVPLYRKRYLVKPGITGRAQTNGCRGQLDTFEKAVKRIEQDLYYIRNWTLWFDLKILSRTVLCLLKDDEAY